MQWCSKKEVEDVVRSKQYEFSSKWRETSTLRYIKNNIRDNKSLKLFFKKKNTHYN